MVLNSSIRRYFDEQNLSIWELPLLTFEYSECKVSLQLSKVLTVYIGCMCFSKRDSICQKNDPTTSVPLSPKKTIRFNVLLGQNEIVRV